jgi:hypothetical protein
MYALGAYGGSSILPSPTIEEDVIFSKRPTGDSGSERPGERSRAADPARFAADELGLLPVPKKPFAEMAGLKILAVNRLKLLYWFHGA